MITKKKISPVSSCIDTIMRHNLKPGNPKIVVKSKSESEILADLLTSKGGL